MPTPDWGSVDIAVPSCRVPGVRMAGFSARAPEVWDIAMVAHPSVTLLFDLSDGSTTPMAGTSKAASWPGSSPAVSGRSAGA
jgi:hypothetical protein